LAGEGEVHGAEIPAGRAVTCLHLGPYNQIHQAYNALQNWVKANGHTPSGIAYEFYLNDPRLIPPGELKTEVVLPLKQ
jgi:effector-binding domain-containing protein